MKKAWCSRPNALHLWLCAQPIDFHSNANPDQELTPAQNEELKQLAGSAYFGWQSILSGFRTLNWNLTDLDAWFQPIPRRMVLAKTGPPTVGLGTLDQLPLEVLCGIISSLDISAIDQFKAVNRRSFEVVNSHPQFRIIGQQAHDTLCALRAIKTDHMITLQTLFEQLCTSQCSECGDYGGYMYLVTFERVCCRCFTEKDRYSPLLEFDALKKFGLTLEILRTLPRFQSYPGIHGVVSSFGAQMPRIPLIDRASAYDAGIARHGSFEAMQAFVANIDSNRWKVYKRAIRGREKELAIQRATKKCEKKATWKAELKRRNTHKAETLKRRREREARKGNGTAFVEGVGDIGEGTDNESVSSFAPESDNDDTSDYDSEYDFNWINYVDQMRYRAPSSKDRDEYDDLPSGIHESLRYKAVMRVPWLNRKSRVEEWGFHCVGCDHREQWPNHAHRDFIMSTFREHLKECGPIRGGVHHIDDCCAKGTCRKREDHTGCIWEKPFWRC